MDQCLLASKEIEATHFLPVSWRDHTVTLSQVRVDNFPNASRIDLLWTQISAATSVATELLLSSPTQKTESIHSCDVMMARRTTPPDLEMRSLLDSDYQRGCSLVLGLPVPH